MISRCFDCVSLFDPIHDGLDIVQRSRESGGQTIGQQAERGVPLRTIQAGDLGTGRLFTSIGAMVGQRAPTVRMQWTARQGCIPPGLLVNVFLAGEVCLESQLHRPPARTGATVAGHSFLKFPPLCPYPLKRPTDEQDEKIPPSVSPL